MTSWYTPKAYLPHCWRTEDRWHIHSQRKQAKNPHFLDIRALELNSYCIDNQTQSLMHARKVLYPWDTFPALFTETKVLPNCSSWLWPCNPALTSWVDGITGYVPPCPASTNFLLILSVPINSQQHNTAPVKEHFGISSLHFKKQWVQCFILPFHDSRREQSNLGFYVP